MPKISVIVPVYNVEKFLNRCVDSILTQTFSGFELILVDDGSPDNCGKICDEYAKKDNRVHVIHKENGGLSDARNAGIDWAFENSDSEWITLIDSDDWVSEKYLEILYNTAVSTNTNISCCCYKDSHGENVFEESDYKTSVYTSELFYVDLATYAITACMKLYKKELFRDIRFPVGKLNEDAFTTYKLIFNVDKVSFVDIALYAYYQSSNSIMRSPWNEKKLDALTAFKEQMEFFHSHKYNGAYKQSIFMYANSVAAQMQICKSSGSTVPNSYYMLRKLLRQHLLRHRKVARFSIEKHNYYYRYAFPVCNRIYWFLQAVKNKLHHILNNKNSD